MYDLCFGIIFTESQNGCQGPLEIVQSNFPAQSRVSQTRLLGTVSSWVLTVFRDGDSTASLGTLCHSITLTRKKKKKEGIHSETELPALKMLLCDQTPLGRVHLGGVQECCSPGEGPVQPAVGDPALAAGLNQVIHRGPFQLLTLYDSVILRFCDSVGRVY